MTPARLGEARRPTRAQRSVRVSTEKQADRGISLDAQRAKAEAYAQLAKAAEPAPTARERTTPKQLAVIWSCMRQLGIEEATFREQVTTRFVAQPEDLGPKVASELIGQLTAKANGGRGKAAA